ncbi:MAG: hypothetical protein M3314_13095, partial [Actinomycetota bacterium]|nr:hypothetical protein [Actinomycetota bacterium]
AAVLGRLITAGTFLALLLAVPLSRRRRARTAVPAQTVGPLTTNPDDLSPPVASQPPAGAVPDAPASTPRPQPRPQPVPRTGAEGATPTVLTVRVRVTGARPRRPPA